MPVTLAQASLNAASDIDRTIINEFRKNSYLMDQLPFVQSVNPDGGGSTLVYGYTRQITQRSAAFRAINAEYTPTEVTKAQYTTELRPLGGSFQIDRVLTGIGAISEVSFQLQATIDAAKAYFSDQVVNGDTGVTADGFDGLSVALAGSATEVNAGGPVLDLTAVDTQFAALQLIQRINSAIALMDGLPNVLLMNGTAKSWFSLIASLSGQLSTTRDDFGGIIERFRGIPIIDLGEKAGNSNPVVGTYVGTNETQTITVDATGGTFTLTFSGQTTAAIAEAATAAAVTTALEALSNVNAGDIVVTGSAGGPFTATFGGRYAGINVPLMTVDGAALTGGAGTAVVTAGTAGGGGTGTGQTGLTDIYGVRFGQDGFHGVSVTGPLIRQWLPDFTTAGAVKTGEVEMGPVSVALKRTRAAFVIRNVKVA